jgi:hypothetical protein
MVHFTSAQSPFGAGLPDGIFQTRNPDLGKTLESLAMEVAGIVIICQWSILWLFGMFCGHLVYLRLIAFNFLRLGMLHQEKSGNPALELSKNRSHYRSLEEFEAKLNFWRIIFCAQECHAKTVLRSFRVARFFGKMYQREEKYAK